MSQDTHGLSKDGTLRGRLNVHVASIPEDERAEAEKQCGEQECEPVPDALLGIHHADLADQSTNVDEQVEVLCDLCKLEMFNWKSPEVTNHVDS